MFQLKVRHARPLSDIGTRALSWSSDRLPLQNMPNLVFEAIEEAGAIVSCQSRDSPSDEEWDAWLECAGRTILHAPIPRTLVVTDGGYPTRAQQGRLAAGMKEGQRSRNVQDVRGVLTAVVSGSSALRFVVSTLTFANPAIKCFSPGQMEAALRYLHFEVSDFARVKAVIDRLRQALRSTEDV